MTLTIAESATHPTKSSAGRKQFTWSYSRLLVEVLGRRKFPGHGVAGDLESLRGDLSGVFRSCSEAAGCKMPHDANLRFLAGRYPPARLARLSRLQRAQSIMRECAADSDYWVSFAEHDNVR